VLYLDFSNIIIEDIMTNYTEETKVLTKRGELPLGSEFSKKPVIVRTHKNGLIEIIPAAIKPMISEADIKKAHKRFKKDHAEANRLLKDG
jgi:hypothetical protein